MVEEKKSDKNIYAEEEEYSQNLIWKYSMRVQACD
jgi:hypothetical protein